jgi:hypothetical protein
MYLLTASLRNIPDYRYVFNKKIRKFLRYTDQYGSGFELMNISVPEGLGRNILEKPGFSGSAGGGGAQGLAFSCCPAATKILLNLYFNIYR